MAYHLLLFSIVIWGEYYTKSRYDMEFPVQYFSLVFREHENEGVAWFLLYAALANTAYGSNLHTKAVI